MRSVGSHHAQPSARRLGHLDRLWPACQRDNSVAPHQCLFDDQLAGPPRGADHRDLHQGHQPLMIRVPTAPDSDASRAPCRRRNGGRIGLSVGYTVGLTIIGLRIALAGGQIVGVVEQPGEKFHQDRSFLLRESLEEPLLDLLDRVS
jgi:hypothetical protein